MEKQKRWQFAVICTVILLTLYNILPTIIFYSKPLRAPITEPRAEKIEEQIANRVNTLEQESVNWLSSFCDLIHVNSKSIAIKPEDPSCILVEFHNDEQADKFRKLLPRAGLEIPFLPSQLSVVSGETGNVVAVLRRQGFHFNQGALGSIFHYSTKRTSENQIAPFYLQMIEDRTLALVEAMLHQPFIRKASDVLQVSSDNNRSMSSSAIHEFANDVVTCSEIFPQNSLMGQRYLAMLRFAPEYNASLLIGQLKKEKEQIVSKVQSVQQEMRAQEDKDMLLDQEKVELVAYLTKEISVLEEAISIVTQHTKGLVAAQLPTQEFFQKRLKESVKSGSDFEAVCTLDVAEFHPLFQKVSIDWANDVIQIQLQNDIYSFLHEKATHERIGIYQEAINRLITNEIARISQQVHENIQGYQGEFRVMLAHLPDSNSFLAMNLPNIGAHVANQTIGLIRQEWKPLHVDFQEENFSRVTSEEYTKLAPQEKKLCLAVFSPKDSSIAGLQSGPVYVLLRGVQNILDQYKQVPDSEEAKQVSADIEDLARMLYHRGYVGYPAEAYLSSRGVVSPQIAQEFRFDYIFELSDYYTMLLKATREDFYVPGMGDYAILEFTDVEQRLIALNRIEDAIQEDLLRWKEEYSAAQVDLNSIRRYTVPKPTQSPLVQNFLLATRKYFRGDDKKILRWGLDLSGGKSVRIALVDQAGKRVESDAQLQQAANELYTRINKMGVSERVIRIENATILLEFPGSQALSAKELIKASAMYFHVVNEQFGPFNESCAKQVHDFLQQVWNEAVVTNRKDVESINQIAYQKLEQAAQGNILGVMSSARYLYEKGLRLADPHGAPANSSFNDSLSSIARFGSDDIGDWNDSTHPLLIVFHNYALEGSSLENIRTGYDPSKGNMLTFGVRNSFSFDRENSEQMNGDSPRDDFYAWTSPFCEERILGTPKEAYSKGRGWRMAVILNGQIISAPSLNSPLRDHAMITGHFSQREVSKLAVDLSAGSLSFTPKILSEQNISPDLGLQEKQQSMIAAFIGILCVFVIMCGYYRFAGVVASIAVIFNILILWAVMQNIDAVLTLPGIAGIVLTVGMAVDANVLVFERIREEFKKSKRIISAIQSGYRKAFSAIIDSNLTTILVALILLQFDCGPIRGFAVTLIIGIIASMFTALFMTRYYFAGWVRNPEHTELKMKEWIKVQNFDFLKRAKPAAVVVCSLLITGAVVFSLNYRSMLGMDFTGGYSLVIDLEDTQQVSLRQQVVSALLDHGVTQQEVQVQELGRPYLLRLQLATSLELPGRPFHNMTTTTDGSGYEKNPRIAWVVRCLEEQGLKIKPSSLASLDMSWTAMSGQFSGVMRNNAILALLFALVGVLVYIAIRFEWQYAVSSLLALAVDVLLTLSVAAVAHVLGAPIQINLELVGAIMMIIGYSLNDTIIVFDRIREDVQLYRKMSYSQIVNLALNTTLSRTVLTSATTLAVLMSLVVFGSSSLFGFAFVMTVGVLLGTFSSLFVACPILLYLHNRDQIKVTRE